MASAIANEALRARSALLARQASEDFPLAQPPPGRIANFEHPDSIAWQLFVGYGICVFCILLFTGLWLWAKLSSSKKSFPNFTEALFLGTVVGVLSYCTMAAVLASYPVMGRYSYEILFRDLTKTFFVLSFLTAALVFVWLCLIKICIFSLYFEIFGRLRWMKICCWIGIVLTGAWSLAGMLGWTIPCSPRGNDRIAWLTATSSPRCTQSQHIVIFHGVMNVITDCYMIVLPLPAIWRLHLQTKKKIGIFAMFLTASVGLIASILGLYYRVRFSRAWTTPTGPIDLLRLSIPNYIVNILEMTAAILVFCMPSLVGLLRRYRKSLQSTFSSTRQLLSLSRLDPFAHTSNSKKSDSLDGRSGSLHSTREPTPKETAKAFVTNLPGTKNHSNVTMGPDKSYQVPPLPNSNAIRSWTQGHKETEQPTELYAMESFPPGNIQKRMDFRVEHGVV